MSLAKVFEEVNALSDARLIETYALGGALAAVRYLEPAATEDVDIFVVFRGDVGSTLAPLTPIYDFLIARGARPEAAHVVIGSWPVQILPAESPLLREAMAEAISVTVEGLAVRIFCAEHLAAIALATGRAKDKLRLTQFLEWDGFDRARFDRIVSAHEGLLARWQVFKRQFLDEA